MLKYWLTHSPKCCNESGCSPFLHLSHSNPNPS